MQLYLLTGQVKLEAVCKYISEVLLDKEDQEKYLIFAHHKEVLDGIEALLLHTNFLFTRIDGSASAIVW